VPGRGVIDFCPIEAAQFITAVLASAPSPVRGRTPAPKESLDHRRRYRRV